MEFTHVPVLLNESIESLNIKPDGVYIDCTMGRGGHSSAILERLSSKGRLIGIDRDPDAIAALTKKFADAENVTIIKGNFFDVKNLVSGLLDEGADGIFADLGVSSCQLDDVERGFSYRGDAPLDMRMSKEGLSAYDVVNTYSENELTKILFAYGEEKFSKSIARRIIAEREKEPIKTTGRLADIVTSGIPARARRTGGNPCKRTFQAIRIEVNGELDGLGEAVENMFSLLKVGGAESVITFHSLEDRAVKTKFRELCTGCICDPRSPVCTCGRTPAAELQFRSVTPGEEELLINPRSKSARLRSIIKLK